MQGQASSSMEAIHKKQNLFGVADTMNFAPNQQDTSSSASNSEIIAINNQVNGLLVGNDVRKNYFLVGSTWTFGGTAPNGLSYNPATPDFKCCDRH